MADDLFLALSNTLIAGRFAVDASQVLLDAGGGLPAYLARDRMAADGRCVALAVSRDASPRARPLRVLNELVDNLMVPLGHGVAPLPAGKGVGYFVICTPPPGPPVSAALNPWSEKVLIDLVLRPAARVLEHLHGLNLTHRAIRPNNVFQSAPNQPVTLGAAWAAPPAMHQPTVFEFALQRDVPSRRPRRWLDRRRCLCAGRAVAHPDRRPAADGQPGRRGDCSLEAGYGQLRRAHPGHPGVRIARRSAARDAGGGPGPPALCQGR